MATGFGPIFNVFLSSTFSQAGFSGGIDLLFKCFETGNVFCSSFIFPFPTKFRKNEQCGRYDFYGNETGN